LTEYLTTIYILIEVYLSAFFVYRSFNSSLLRYIIPITRDIVQPTDYQPALRFTFNARALRYEAAATSFFIVDARSRVVSSSAMRLVRAAKGPLIAIAAFDHADRGGIPCNEKERKQKSTPANRGCASRRENDA